jgi:hypothetical protein
MRIFILFFALGIAKLYAETDLKQIIEQKLVERTHVKGQYKQKKYLEKIKQSLVSSGTFQFIKGESIEWIQAQPFQSKIKMSSTEFSIVGPDNTSESISLSSRPDMRAIQDVFFSLLNGDQVKLKKYFDLNATGNAKAWQLHLTPQNKELAMVIESITLKGSQWLNEIEIAEKNKNKTTIEFTVKNSL